MANDTLTKPLPQNIDAERAILGAILLDNATLSTATEKLTSGDFYFVNHKIIFHAMLELRELSMPIDSLTLFDQLTRTGEIEFAGGAPYIAQLTDNVPHVTNVPHYAQIVYEKSTLRKLIKKCAAVESQAMESGANSELLYADIQSFAQQTNGNGHGRKRMNPVTLAEVATMNLKPVSFVIEPILPEQGLGMLYSKRGTGKTFVALEIGISVAMGTSKLFSWKVPKPRPVLYVDGEMPANRMQARLRSIVMGHGMRELPGDPTYFRIITPDLQERGVFPNISSREGQNLIEEHLTGFELLILDNLSALCRSGKENEGDDWVPVAEWALRLRQRGISVLFIHHAGKGGEQRGTSRREDLLDCVIALRPTPEHHASDGLRCEVHMEKLRNSGADESVFPFELTMQTAQNGAIYWTQRPLKEVIEINALKMFSEGMSIRDVAEELHISKHRAHQIKNRGVKLPE